MAGGTGVNYNQALIAFAISTFTLSGAATAQVIDTTGSWDGQEFVYIWGSQGSIYGQSFTATAAENVLNDFTFYLSALDSSGVSAVAYVYAWDSAANKVVGNALYESQIFNAPTVAAMSPVTIDTGGITLNAGSEYAIFLKSNGSSDQSSGQYSWGRVGTNPYAGGSFFYTYLGPSTQIEDASYYPWIESDLAFIANFGPAVPVITAIDTGAAFYNASALGTTLTPNFEGGTLRMDQANAAYGDNFTLDGSSTNTIDQYGNSSTFNGVFSDAVSGTPGNLTIANSGQGGSVTLSWMNTYTGTTTIEQGATLSLYNQGRINQSSLVTVDGTFDISQAQLGQIKDLAGSGSVVLGSTPLLITAASQDFGGVISGAGGVNVLAGTQTLSGENTFTGGLGISQGATVVIGNGGTTGSIDSNVNNYGTLAFDRSDASTYAGAVTGGGSFELRSGDLTLTGASSSSGNVDIASGSTLRLGNGGTTGWIGGTNYPGTINVGGTLVYNRSNDQTFRGAYAGAGSIVKEGAGTIGFAGNSSGFNGSTTINAGAINLSGTLGGAVTIASSGKLSLTANGQLAGTQPLTVNGTFDVSGAAAPSVTSLAGAGSVVLGNQSLAITNAQSNFSGVISGGGGLAVNGGWQNLSGANTYSGQTYIADGATVALTTGGSIVNSRVYVDGGFDIGKTSTPVIRDLAGSGSVTLGANTLNVTAGQSSFSGDISGTGGLTVSGGTLGLYGANSYTGETTIAANAALGLLDNGSIAASSLVNANGLLFVGTANDAVILDLTGSGSVILDNVDLEIADASQDFSGAISGSGGMLVSGGTQILSGNNSFTGGLEINANAGAVIGNGGTSGVLTSNVLNNGTLAFDRSDASTYAGVVAGSGAFELRNGDLTLTGDSSIGDVSVANGATLRLGNGDTTGWIGGNDGSILVDGTLAYNRSDLLAWNGTYSGNGSIVKSGSGSLVLTGDSSGFAGLTTVSSGALYVGNSAGEGALGGSLLVASGGVLGGAGTIGSGAGSKLTIAANGVLTPGNSIGTLTVDGDVIFEAGSRFEVETAPGGADSDLLYATGSATLGGTVAHIGMTGNYDPQSAYTILSADSGLVGQFDNVTSDFAFLNPILSYTANDTVLTLQRNDIEFVQLGQTPNQLAVAAALETLTFGNDLYDHFVQLDEDSAVAAFDQLTGEAQASVQTALIESAELLRNTANDRIRGAFGSVAAPSLPVMSYASEEETGKMPGVFAPESEPGPAIWGTAFGAWGTTDGNGNAAGFDRSSRGLVTGVDGQLDTWRVGVLAGYTRTDFDVDARASSADIDNYHLGIYGGTQWGAIGLRTGLGYTWSEIDSRRSVVFPGFNESLTGEYDAGTFQAFGELGYKITAAQTVFEPFANLAHVNVRREGFSETGGASALTFGKSSTDTTFTTLGLRAEHEFAFGTSSVRANGSLGWRHAFGDTAPVTTQLFDGSSAFSITGAPVVRDVATVEAGLDFSLSPDATLGVSYQGQFGSGFSEHGGKIGFNLSF